MRELSFPKQLIQNYYGYDFGIDLRQYFYIKPMVNHPDIALIGHLEWQDNPHRKCNGSPACRYSLSDFRRMPVKEIPYVTNETEKHFIFAGIFYFLVLVPQILQKMFGEEVQYDFYRCTGWPLISAGLGGSLAPRQMLIEASLYPNFVERRNFHRMLTEVVPFVNDELRRFFRQEDRKNLNNEAYFRMLAAMNVRIDDFISEVRERSVAFRDSLYKG